MTSSNDVFVLFERYLVAEITHCAFKGNIHLLTLHLQHGTVYTVSVNTPQNTAQIRVNLTPKRSDTVEHLAGQV